MAQFYVRGDFQKSAHQLLRERLDQALAFSIGSGHASVKHSRLVGEVYDSDLLASDKERGLHARAGHCGAGLPCKISYVTIPLKENVDDPSFQLVEWPIILPEDFASTLVSEGYLAALVRDLRDLPAYWEGMLKDFPGHPAKDNDPQLRASIGCTLYGDEIDCLNDSWMFLLWSSDTSPVLSHSPSSRWPICIVPASRYVYENGVNITIQALTHAIANSFNRLSNFGIPVRDLASLGGGLVGRLRLYVLGYRGDWKALVALFNMKRNYSVNEVCWLCQATKGQDDDLSCCMTDVSPTAGWWQTFLREAPWDSPPSYSNITGFEIGMVVPDLLHCWNLGLARDLLGSALKLILSERLVFNAPCIADRLKLASESLRAFAKQKRYPLRIKKLTKSKLCWQTRKYPSLAASGYDAFVVGVWLEDLLSNHSQTFPEICTMLWAGNRAISLMYSANLFLNEEEK